MAYDFQTGVDPGTSYQNMDVNQAGERKKPVNREEYQSTPEEEEIVKMVHKRFQIHKKWRKKYDADWLENYKMFRGDQWKYKRPSYRHNDVINLVFKTIQSMVPMQTDARPKFEFLPTEPSDFELSKMLNMLSQSDWEREAWLYNLVEIIYDSYFYSGAFGYVGWDADAMDGLGAPCFESEDPFYLYPDPNARDVNDNGKRSCYFIKAEPVDIELLKKRYPKFAKYFKSDLQEFKDAQRDFRPSDSQDNSYYESLNNDIDLLLNDGTTKEDVLDKALELTLWWRDPEVVTVMTPVEQPTTVTDPMTGQPVEQMTMGEKEEKRLKYPKGRKIVVINKMVVSDGKNEFDDGRFPFFKHVNYILPREFYGVSEVEQIKGPQRTFNMLISFALDVLTLMGNPIWIVDNNSNVDTDELYNKPGMIVEKAAGTEVRRESGVQLQPYVMNMITQIQSLIEDVSGNRDVSEGVAGQVTAASAIESLQEAANTRIRQKSRILDKALKEFGQMWLSRTLQFSTSPRVYRLTGLNGSEKYFKFHVDQDSKQAVYQLFSDEGQPEQPQKVNLTTDFDVRVVTGSSLSLAKKDKFNKYMALYNAKAISKKSLLEAADVDSVDVELQRLQEEQDALMMSQVQMQQNTLQQPPPIA